MIKEDFVAIILYFLHKKHIKSVKLSQFPCYYLLTFATMFSIIVAQETVALATIFVTEVRYDKIYEDA